MTGWVVLLDVAGTSMRHSLGDIGKSSMMIECLSRIEKFLQVLYLQAPLGKSRPVICEPGVQLLDVEEVFSSEPDGLPNLLSLDLV